MGNSRNKYRRHWAIINKTNYVCWKQHPGAMFYLPNVQGQKERVPKQMNTETKISQLNNGKDAIKMGSHCLLPDQNTSMGKGQKQSEVIDCKGTFTLHLSTYSLLSKNSR